ncbi:MAG: mechanosensitive ion channel domain-containing protein, partial [Promethearchaeota archaeon]
MSINGIDDYDFIPEFIKNFISKNDYLHIGNWDIPVNGIISLVVLTVLIILVYKIFSLYVSRKMEIRGMLPDMYNGIIFFFRIIFAFVFVILITFLLNIESKYIILISGITGTAVSFASMKAMNNFVAGVWISLTRPFNVGDYVEIGGKEGIIIEILLNYTKIKHRDGNVTLIPNMSCLKSELINYSISKDWFTGRIEGLENIIRSLKLRNINDEANKNYTEFVHLEEKLGRFKKNFEEIKQILKQIEERGYKKYKKHSQYASE